MTTDQSPDLALAARLRHFNAWRRDNSGEIEMPNATQHGRDLDAAADAIERLHASWLDERAEREEIARQHARSLDERVRLEGENADLRAELEALTAAGEDLHVVYMAGAESAAGPLRVTRDEWRRRAKKAEAENVDLRAQLDAAQTIGIGMSDKCGVVDREKDSGDKGLTGDGSQDARVSSTINRGDKCGVGR